MPLLLLKVSQSSFYFLLLVSLVLNPIVIKEGLDVTFGEDASRIRQGNAPENIALLKRWSINLLNQETSFKRSTRQNAKRASIDITYLLKVLNTSIPSHFNSSDT